MNPATPPPLPPPAPVPPLSRTLRKLFLTLFLRGRTSRGLQKQKAPKSVGSKLTWSLLVYALFGMLITLAFWRQPVFALSLYVHAMTLMFLGMFVAASAGEVLFNKEEADILMHRPVTPRALLWAKISVLVQVSLWLAGAFNLGALIAGVNAKDGGWLFLLVHGISTVIEALFCTGCVVLVYQLCLRWFGRERLDALMTTAQVLVSVGVVVGSQIVPQVIGRVGGKLQVATDAWWVKLLPPAWFAGFDDALAGRRAAGSWVLAAIGLLVTATVLWLAFGRLAQSYAAGLQTLNEATGRPPKRAGRRWLEVLVNAPPLCWWLKDSVSRAAFLLTAAYLVRDRDVKLRVYPGIAPILVMPLVILLPGRGTDGVFGIAFAGGYLGLVPLLALNLLQYSQQWQAADIFRAAPVLGPGPLCHGVRRAVLCLLAVPALALFAAAAWALGKDGSHLALLLPGVVALPVYAMIPCLGGKAVPFSQPTEEARSARRGLVMLAVMPVALLLSALGMWAWSGGWFTWLLLVEIFLVFGIYGVMRSNVAAARWPSME